MLNTVNPETVEVRVRRVIARNNPYVTFEQITNEMRLAADIGMDSLDVVEALMDTEDEFHIEISDEEAEGVATVQQAIDLVHAILQRHNGAQLKDKYQDPVPDAQQ